MIGFDAAPARPRRTAAPGTGAPAIPRARSRKGEGDKLREEILDAAEQLLMEKGSVEAVSMRAIASRVGVTPPSIYLHFDDKRELFFQACSRSFDELSEVVAGAVSDGTFVERITAVGHAYVEFGLSRGEQYEAMFRNRPPDDLTEEEAAGLPGHRALTVTAELVRRGIEAGEIRGDLVPEAVAISLWAALHGLVLILLAKEDVPYPLLDDADLIIDQTFTIIIEGLRAQVTSP